MGHTKSPKDGCARLIFVIGCPGAGKGSLCSKLAIENDWCHISAGDELRKYVKVQPEDSEVVECVAQSKLVSVEKLADVLSASMKFQRNANGEKSFLVDGIPRHIDQIERLEVQLGTPDQVLLLNCPKDKAQERVLSRNLEGRSDSANIFEQRYSEYEANKGAIEEYYKSKHKLIEVDSSLSVKESYANLLLALEGSQALVDVKRGRSISRVYIIGVSATGKTTLIGDLVKHFAIQEERSKLGIITEVARKLVQCSGLSPPTIRSGDKDSMQLQRTILWVQRVRENAASTSELVLADRSGLDPLVFAKYYGQDNSMFAAMARSEDWTILHRNMQQDALVVLCEPQISWYVEDDVRVVLDSASELAELHQVFLELLREHQIPFVVLPSHIDGREPRVSFVLEWLKRKSS